MPNDPKSRTTKIIRSGQSAEDVGDANLNVWWYRTRNWARKVIVRALHPWPFYKKVGGIDAVVIRKDGTRENLGKVAPVYGKRWQAGAGGGGEDKAAAKAAERLRKEVERDQQR